MKKSILVSGLIFFANVASAQVQAPVAPIEASDPRYYELSKPTLVEIADPDPTGSWMQPYIDEVTQSSSLSYATSLPTLKTATTSVSVDEIIAVGKLVWNIIEKNQPKVDVKTNRMSVLPKAAKDWTDLERWSNPESRVFKIAYKNGFGSEIVSFSFRVVYFFGGRYNGAGKYIANVTVIPTSTYVGWGYTLNSRVEFPTIVNLGTLLDPIVGAQLDVSWEVETVMKKSRESASYFVRGDGQIIDLTYGF
ncbi:MAG: hypothetical protein JNL01_01130 [Bdellovibrionales bacterium]|nr:hypothetical protein [Bdellovibrionales bacterium]